MMTVHQRQNKKEKDQKQIPRRNVEKWFSAVLLKGVNLLKTKQKARHRIEWGLGERST